MSTEAPSADPLMIRANKLDLLERLADDLAHEIKNPLHSMVINLEVLKRRLARAGLEGEEEVLRYVGVLGGELERVNRRIELLLRLSRPGRGAEQTTLNELTEELMELVQLEARQQDVTLRYEPGLVSARVFVPREQARQVILNVVLDVLDGLGRGDVLHVVVEQEDGSSRMLVRGTPADSDAPRLIGDPEAAEGVRLQVARAVAEAIGGRIDSADGGATLVLVLPASRA